MRPANPICVALDTPDPAEAQHLAEAVRGSAGMLKLGLEHLSMNGAPAIARIAAGGLPVFADVKFHDIPNTVAGASAAIARAGAALFNVHAAGGIAMMAAARTAARAVNPAIAIVAVTVLTSLDAGDLAAAGVGDTPADHALRLAELAREAGLDGVVCSAHEISAMRRAFGPEFLLVVPGLRPAGAEAGDQKRVMTPAEARARGADILVIGRPVTAAADPGAAARAIAAGLG